MRPVLELDARLVKSDNGIVLDIDNVNIGPVELLQICVFEAWSLDTPVVRHVERCKYVPLLRIVNASPLLLGPEVVRFLVGLRVEKVVLVVAQPVAESAILP